MLEPDRLSELSIAIRESTIKRLRRVPSGGENWRPSAASLSLADIAHHILRADSWLLEKLADPSTGKMVAHAGEFGKMDRAPFVGLIEQLEVSGLARAARLGGLSVSQLTSFVPDDRFGGEVSVWWVVVRGDLDHEAHRSGQLATVLRILDDAFS